MKIIKRSGSEVPFDIDKIVNAIKAANNEVPQNERLTDEQVALAAHSVEWLCGRSGHTVSVEEIQDMVENQIMSSEPYAKRSTHGTMIMFARIGGTDTR